MEEDVSSEAVEEVLPADEILEEPGSVAESARSDQLKGVPVKYLIIGGAGLLVLIVVGFLLYFLVFSGPKIKPAAVVSPGETVPVVQAPAQPAPPSPASSQVNPPAAPEPTPAPAPPEPKPVAPPASAAPEKTKPAAAPAPKPEPEKKPVQVAAVPRFTLSLGIFTEEEEVKANLTKLKGLGLEPVSEEKTVTTQKYFIYLNEKLTQGQAKANSFKLKMINKIENEIVPQPDGTARVRVGPITDKNQATEMKGRMEGAGYSSEIQTEESKGKGFLLKVGKFATRDEANKTIATLKQKGLKAEIVSLD
ncbi:MAG: SPOR domain-containing protein [Proteobacteria bacterium]|nr:SPOR domain-containing protein [Pseudomonadota bacterium]